MHAVKYDEYGGLDVLHRGDIPAPSVAADEALIRTKAASLNPFDWKLRSGSLSDVFRVEFPVTPGRDGYGEVVSLPGGADAGEALGLELGQRVCFLSSRIQHGSLGELAAVRAQDFIVPAPRNLSDEECAALPMVGVSAWNALVDTAQVQPGMRVLIHGASGGIGSIAVQLARHLGAEVYATCSAAKAATVEAMGAVVLPYDEVDFTNEVSDCDVVLDTVGGDVHERSYAVLKPGGCLAYLIARPFGDPPERHHGEARRVMVSNRPGTLRNVVELADRGILRPHIGASLPFAEFREAFKIAESGRAPGRVVLTRAEPRPEAFESDTTTEKTTAEQDE